ncbi:MAG: M15 family metallopeptidase [Steroidobacteraceae bacterium]
MLGPLELTGRTRAHVVEIAEPRCTLHAAVVEPLLALRGAALADGIDLLPVSSFRDFARQCTIWNEKFRGERPLLDRDGEPMEAAGLTPAERVEAILWWSALPGASRHHWGTDFDVIDAAALPPDVRPQLVPAEFAPGGPFARLDAWLEANMRRYGFFRPYVRERGGVSPEPWHLSYAPLAEPALAALDAATLRAALEQAPIEGRDIVLARIAPLHARYVAAIDRPRTV